MIHRLKQIFKKSKNNIYRPIRPIRPIRPFCGREHCYCVHTLNLDKKEHYKIYLKCYRSHYKSHL